MHCRWPDGTRSLQMVDFLDVLRVKYPLSDIDLPSNANGIGQEVCWQKIIGGLFVVTMTSLMTSY